MNDSMIRAHSRNPITAAAPAFGGGGASRHAALCRALAIACVACTACGSRGRDRLASIAADADAAAPADAGLNAHVLTPVEGAPISGQNQPIVVVRSPIAACTAVLVASDVALAPLSCVLGEGGPRCATGADAGGAAEPLTIDARAFPARRTAHGEPEALARVDSLLLPAHGSSCDSGLGALVFDRDVDAVAPASTSTTAAGLRVGDHVWTVGRAESLPETLVAREHAAVARLSAPFVSIAERGCDLWPGAAAIDERSGALVGVLVGEEGPCPEGASGTRYAHIEAVRELVDRALASDRDTHGSKVGRRRRGTKRKPPTLVGEACAGAGDCPSSVCVSVTSGAYCSRICGRGDRCPTGMRCALDLGERAACLRAVDAED